MTDAPKKKDRPKKSPTEVDEPAATERGPAAAPAELAEVVERKPSAPAKKVRLRVRRQDGPERADSRRFEEFEVAWRPQLNVHGCLEAIRKNPVTTEGKRVAPVAWEASCLEEVCGSCTMLVNGKVRQACSTLVDQVSPKGQTIVLEPMTKFPLERDLVVDRSRMFDALKHVKAWVELDGTHALGAGPRESQDAQRTRYPLSRCMTCGSCLEACPQYGQGSAFIGAAAISQARLMNLHPTGALQKRERVEALMTEGGVADCGKAQNCVEVCPKEIPLVDSIADMARETTKQMLFGWLLK